MLTFEEDDYVRELQDSKRKAPWRAELSDGRVAVMDDGRPGVRPHSAWLRLADFLKGTGLRVRRLWLGFRSNQHRGILPLDADGYYFRYQAVRYIGEEQMDFVLLGALNSGNLVVQRWQVPEMVLVDVEARDPAGAGPSLILNPPRCVS